MDGETAQSWENEQRNEGQIGNEKQAKGKQTERIETEEARGRWCVNGGRKQARHGQDRQMYRIRHKKACGPGIQDRPGRG